MEKDFTQIVDAVLFRRFFEAWQKLRVGDALPARKAVSLRDFAPFAADLLIYELPTPDFLNCRLMGSHVSDRVKIGNADLNWFDFIVPDMVEDSKIWWGSLFSTPCAGVMQFSTGFLNGTSRISQAMLLPVQTEQGQIHLLTLSNASSVYAAGEPREKLIILHDCSQVKSIDVGFGLPDGIPERIDYKVLDADIADLIFAG